MVQSGVRTQGHSESPVPRLQSGNTEGQRSINGGKLP